MAELGGANSGVALGSVYAAYSYGPGGLTSRSSGLSGEYGAFAFDIAGNVAVRQRQVNTDMDASEVYDAYGRVYERFNVQGANPDPVTDPIGSLAQFGNRTEEEDRAAVAARYVRQIDGELYDPATGRRIKSQTALSGNALADRISNGVTDPLRLTGQIAAGAFKGAASNFAFGLFAGDPSLQPRTKLEAAGKQFGSTSALLWGGTAGAAGTIRTAYRATAGTTIRGIAGVPKQEKEYFTYTLTTSSSGIVVRTGRTSRLLKRIAEHRSTCPDLEFNIDMRSFDYEVIRAREQVISDHYKPILNKIHPIQERFRWLFGL